jgi:hypothetical protein
VGKKKRSGRSRQSNPKVSLAHRRAAKASAESVKSLAAFYESPPAEEELQGHQTHFLERTVRLTDEARAVALGLYYDFPRRRFVARSALGLMPYEAGFKTDPDDLASRRVAIGLEPGNYPSRLIVDGRGQVITCLAPDMAVGDVTVVTFKELQDHILMYENFTQIFKRSGLVAEKTDLLKIAQTIAEHGWHCPSEILSMIWIMGPSVSAFVAAQLELRMVEYCRAYRNALIPQGQTDRDLRAWWRATGELTALLSILADQLIEPNLDKLAQLMIGGDPVLNMVLGTLWTRFSNDIVDALWDLMPDPDKPVSYWAPHILLVMNLGVRRRMLLREGHTIHPKSKINRRFDRVFDSYDREHRERKLLDIPPDPMIDFVRDLTLLTRGGRPEWGDDLIGPEEDVRIPLRVEDLSLPDGSTSFRLPRLLAQKLLRVDLLYHHELFLTGKEIDAWEEQNGPIDEVRKGIFRFPWLEYKSEDQEEPERIGRNEPCPCGSGKKYKKCCLLQTIRSS